MQQGFERETLLWNECLPGGVFLERLEPLGFVLPFGGLGLGFLAVGFGLLAGGALGLKLGLQGYGLLGALAFGNNRCGGRWLLNCVFFAHKCFQPLWLVRNWMI